LAARWSPRSFDENHELSDSEIHSILEAARWAPSANNWQPWRFSVAKRGSELHQKVAAGLTGFNQAWAPSASALIVLSVKKKDDGTTSHRNFYDAGLAMALLSVQVQSMGLYSHQMSGIVFDQLTESLEIPDDLEVAVVIAIGKKDSPEKFEGSAYEREIAPRTRLPLEEIVVHGLP
ncbi:MAG: nitroreductase family protein, partial [Actinomycetota bacterium]